MSSANPNSPRVWIFGSDGNCEVVVRGPDISPRHCLLAEYPQGHALEDLGSAAGTWVNGQRLTEGRPQWVTRADHIRLGSTQPFPWPADLRGSQRGATQVEIQPGLQARAGVAATGGGQAAPPPPGALRVVRIGRGQDNDVVLDYPMISWNHARLVQERDGRLFIEDLGSTNGVSVGSPGQRVQRSEVRADDKVFFGSFKVLVSRLLSGEKVSLGAAAPRSTVAIASGETILGRDPQCSYPVDSPVVSWHHAKLIKSARGIEIEDLGSRNGTFVDGQPIQGRVLLKPGSEFGLGSMRFKLLDESGKLEHRDYSGNVTIEAVGVVVEVKKGGTTRRLLDPVSLTVFPSELVALMGLAGAGKTTLMKALNGYTRPAAGQVLFNGEDLYAHQDQFRLQVGYVPQDDILHTQLTVKEALYYTAKLRTDLRPEEIDARIEKVLKDLGIEDISGRLIGSPERKVISGGQRKRVNIAMELLSDPSVLFLDEPTSGLSSYDAYQVVRLLRRLADSGKTIICTIHQPSVDIFKEFDSLMIVARDKGDNAGLLAYFGPAYPASIEFFAGRSGSEPSPEQLMTGLASRKASEWHGSYKQSAHHRDFVESRSGRVVSTAGQTAAKPRRRLGVTQMLTLFQRNTLLRLRDRTQSLILLAQAPLFGILVGIVFHGLKDQAFTDPSKWAEFCSKLASAHFLTVVAAVWFGCNNAARDIVGETAIFLRERMVNLKLPSYVLSKMGTLAIICLFQCIALLTIVYFTCGLSGSFLTLLGVLFLASLVGASIGLLISAMAPTTESAIAFLPVVLLPFILLGGGIKPLHEMPAAARWISAVCPTRWAYEAGLLEESANRRSTFTNALEEQLVNCRNAVGQCEGRLAASAGRRVPAAASPVRVNLERDVAAAAFPASEGRSTLRRSVEVLAVMLGSCLILLLATLSLKSQQ